MEQYRIQEIEKSYLKTGCFNPKIVAYGSQILYEMEQDKIAMVEAISYLTDYVKYRKSIKETATGGELNCDFALDVLLKRVSKYSCPNALKKHLRTKENCPLKGDCKCETNNKNNNE